MHAPCERIELKDEMLAPGEDVVDGLTGKAIDADSAVSGDGADPLFNKRPELFCREM